MIDVVCQGCQGKMSVPDDLAGKSTKCMWCGATVTVGSAPAGPPATAPAASSSEPDFANLREPGGAYERIRREQEPQGEGNPALGWIIFILIFGVGNVILYSTTGILLIPIRR